MTGKRSVNKAACKRLAAELRAEIGLEAMDALNPWKLAELYGITVIPVSALPLSSEIRDHFTIARPEVFSGALVPIRSGAVIIENDSHPDARRRSTMGTNSPTFSVSTSSGPAWSTSVAAVWPTKSRKTKPPRSAANC